MSANKSTCCTGGDCCGGTSPPPDSKNKVLQSVQDYYGKVLSTSKDLKTSACTAGKAPPKYVLDALRKVPGEIMDKFYGCGTPIPSDITGKTIVDLGSGSGRDCYVAAALVGPTGRVIGIDMTDEQLLVARKHAEAYCTQTLGYPKNILEFKKGYIECLEEVGIAPGSVDVIMSNCVINLSPDKEAVMRGAAAVLKEGGELYFSDVYCDRRLSQKAREHEVLWGECISGALYTEDFKRIALKVGFTDPRVLSQGPIVVKDPKLLEVLGEATFSSVLFRCFKLKSLETLCEDYGQVATYNGGILGSSHAYDLDDHHHFVRGKPMLVCGNTASMVQETRLSPFFTVQGDRSTHYGLFPCGAATSSSSSSTSDGATGCSSGAGKASCGGGSGSGGCC